MSNVILDKETGKHYRINYESRCPACSKTILVGQAVKPYKSARRTLWQHEDCQAAAAESDTGGSVSADVTDQLQALEIRIRELETREPPARKIHIHHPDGKEIEIEGLVHPVFEKVLGLAMARKNIFLPGPAGCGKTHLARQVAEALGLPFSTISCSAGMSESQLTGRLVPIGDQGQFQFVSTEFLDRYENGGVFLFDELDAADPNVLLVINQALANGHLPVPNRRDNPVAKRHPDFVCIAAANTWGRGADRQYVGRNQLDESTLDRFRIGTVPMDYHEDLERQLCPLPDLYNRLRHYRERIRTNRLERLVSTRFICEAYDMVSRWGWTIAQVEEQLFQGWRADEIAKVKNG